MAAAQTNHIVSVRTLLAVWGALVVLTGLTVAVTWVDLGAAALWVALGIATVKGSLVLLYFMHLRWDKAFNAVVFVSTLFFVMLFIGITLMDTTYYQPEIQPYSAPAETTAPAATVASPPAVAPSE